MIRLNVKKDGKVEVKSFVNKKDLQNLFNRYFDEDTRRQLLSSR